MNDQDRTSNKMSNRWNWIMLVVVFIVVVGIFAVYQIYQTHKINNVQNDPFTYSQLPVLGNANAPVRIVEFGDFKCPDCRDWETTVLPKIKQQYIDTGKAKLYFMNFQVIRNSETAELVGRSIYHQSNQAFWEYYTAIYANQGNVREDWATESFLLQFVKGHVHGINMTQLKQDVDQKTYQAEVDQDKNDGKKLGVHATPTIFINGQMVQHPQSMEETFNMIEEQVK